MINNIYFFEKVKYFLYVNKYFFLSKILYSLWYSICILIIFYLIFYIYQKLKYRFWSTQPVYHYYDLYYKLYDNVLICEEGFSNSSKMKQKMNKYIDNYNCIIKPLIYKSKEQVKNYEKIFEKKDNIQDENELIDYFSNKNIQKLHYIVCKNYLKDKYNNYEPLESSLYSYFKNHIKQTYIGFYQIKTPLFQINDREKKVIPYTESISVITSRPLIYHIKNINKNREQVFYENIECLHYVDYLTTQKKYRKKKITPKLICTFANQVEKMEKKPSIFLFKREDSKCGIIPFVSFNSVIFDLNDILKKIDLYIQRIIVLNEERNIILKKYFNNINQIKSENISNIIDFIHLNCPKHYIHSDYLNIKELLQQKIIYIYCLNETPNIHSDIKGLILFRNNETTFNENREKKHIFECFGSLFKKKDKNEKYNEYEQYLRLNLLYGACLDLKKNNNVEYITFENICNNNLILNDLKNENIEEIHNFNNSYYLYNFIKQPILAENILFLM